MRSMVFCESGVSETWSVSKEKRRCTMEEMSKNASDCNLLPTIFQHCSEDQISNILTQLQSNNLWTDDTDFNKNVLPHIEDHQLDSVLTFLVAHKMWETVGKVLQRGVSEEKHRWAVKEMSKKVSDCNILPTILPHCREDQISDILTQLQTNKLWTDDTDFNKNVLPHIEDRQLDSVLIFLVTQRMWGSVGKVLQKGVSKEKHKWAVGEASRTCGQWEFQWDILRHSSKDSYDTDYVLTNLVNRHFWHATGKIIQRGVSDSQLKVIAEESSKTARKEDFEALLPYYTEDVLVSVLPNLEKRGLLCHVASDRPEETPLHAEVSRKPASRVRLIYQLAKGVDPFKTNVFGGSVLFYATGNTRCGREYVAECIRLGFSTHQAVLTEPTTKNMLLKDLNTASIHYRMPGLPGLDHVLTPLRSPFLLAIVMGNATIGNMLYQSGSCSYKELFLFYTLTQDVRCLQKGMGKGACEDLIHTTQSLSPCLKEMATTPRSLVSSCRLVISHCLKVSARRYQDVQQLPLTDKMKNYILFSDLTGF